MAPAGKIKGANSTPGRRKRTGDQFFDIGRVGRKTGITLKDTGIRDEHGLEPVSGIFSSPTSPQQNGDKTLTSEGMDMEESSAPDVTATLTQRKTPRFPPPRQSTPRHTNIGSPKRMSSARQSHRAPSLDDGDDDNAVNSQHRVNRRLEYGATNRNRKSISVVDAQSPFVPKKVLRRSTGPVRPDPFTIPEDDEEERPTRTKVGHMETDIDDDDDVEQSIEQDDIPPMLDNDDEHYFEGEDHTNNEMIEAQPNVSSDSPMRKRRGRPRKSDKSLTNSQIHATPSDAEESISSKKRNRPSLTNNDSLADDGISATGTMGPPSKRKRTSNATKVIVHHDEGPEVMDQSDVAFGDEYVVDEVLPAQDSELAAQLDSQLEVTSPPPKGKGKRQPKAKKGKAAAAPRERDPNRSMTRTGGSPVKVNNSPSKRYRGGSAGPVSNVNLRATTPFDDANQQTSRFGRNLIQPLKYWENESRIWKGGVIEGIVRAEHVENPRNKPNKKRRRTRKRAGSHLQDIEEESETESTMPDEWEDNIGVITGAVANWNETSESTKTGDPEDPITEDLAFAASAIVTRDVAGSDFKYAKIMTMPFFGAGVVEVPPEGYKRAKNSRRMQMVFFVHEGKVVVEVGAIGMEVHSFALSKGGVWVVPRGNNYAITNESRIKTAKIFFAQGCEVTTNVES